MMVSAQGNSSHTVSALKMVAGTNAGLERGKMIEANNVQAPPPSISTDSSMSREIESKKPLSRKVVNGIAPAAYTTMSPHRESNKPS
ncbi:hypothetical protein D3C81_1271710 [compost metagenome]